MRKEALAILIRLINSCWFLFKWSIVAMLATVVVLGGYLFLRLDDEVRRYAENVLAKHYADLDIQLGSAHFEAGRGVVLRNLAIGDRLDDGRILPIAEVDEMQLMGQFNIEALASGRVAIERIRIRSPRVAATRSVSGEWNVARLFPPPSTGSKPADVEVVGAVVTLTDLSSGSGKSITLRDVNLTSQCSECESEDKADRSYHLEGSVGGELAKSFTFQATTQPAVKELEARVQVEGLDLSSAAVVSLWRRLPQLEHVSEMAGKADLTIRVNGQPEQPLSWQADYHVTEGRIALEGVARPLTSIAATGTASASRLFVREATANFGKARLALAFDRRGWETNSKAALRLRAEELTLDENLADMLPEAAAPAWNRFEPRGEISLEVAAQFTGQRWKQDVKAMCHDVSFIDREKFTYRLTSGNGELIVGDRGDGRGPVLDIQNFTAMLDNTPLSIQGSFTGLPGLGERRQLGGARLPPTGWLEITGSRVPITDQLVDALDPREQKVRRIVDSLDAKGQVSVRWKFVRESPYGPHHTETDLTFHHGRVQFEKFPYPLRNIEGTAQERDGNWRFDNLVSREAKTPIVIRAAGTCTKTADNGHDLLLTFVGEQVPLNDTLRLALPAAHQDIWAAVRPESGRVNFVARVGHKVGARQPPSIHLEVAPEVDTVSIRPACFPYRLEKLQGKLIVVNNEVTMNNLRAEHGPTVFETNGHWIPNGRGGWQLEFRDLHVDRLSADYDLRRAAPAGIGKLIDHLQPTGTFSVHNGILRFSRDTPGSTHLRSDWKVSLCCQQNDLELGVPLKSVSGLVHLAGRHEENLRFTAGQLELDSLFWNGMQFTQVRGPLWVDPYECRLGQEATKRMNHINGRQAELSRIRANLYGGVLELDSAVELTAGSRYVVDLKIDKCDLKRMSTDYLAGSVDLSGSLSGQATLRGMGRSLDLLEGGGRVAVSNAQMYELPVMARLLKVLRNRVPDKTAFNGIDAQFALEGQTIRFNELNLLGDAVSMYGKGTATFDRDLDLVFHSTVGRNDFNVPLLKSMIGQASANLLLIKVTGPVENAEVVREPLPAVNEFMEQLGGEGVATPKPTRGFWNR